ncbi:MAG: hypothetical protein R2745_15385 [Vicinamibacterales bacterium]
MTARHAAAAGLALAFLASGVPTSGRSAQAEPTLADVLARAATYVRGYEERFSLLVAEEEYVQEIRRPDNNPSAGNLSRTNPGGGFSTGGGVRKRQTLRSDYLLVRVGGGGGWLPFRDTFQVNGRRVADRGDRLAKLFLEPTVGSLDRASRIMADSTRYNLGSMTRTINIPTLALLFLHPDVRGRFDVSFAATDQVDGKPAWRLEYHERDRPTLIKTTRGRDLPVYGELWVDAATGTVLKTMMTAADPVIRAVVTTTYRADDALDFWVPARMEDYYKALNDVDEVTGVATYANYRRFTVAVDEVIRRGPPG